MDNGTMRQLGQPYQVIADTLDRLDAMGIHTAPGRSEQRAKTFYAWEFKGAGLAGYSVSAEFCACDKGSIELTADPVAIARAPEYARPLGVPVVEQGHASEIGAAEWVAQFVYRYSRAATDIDCAMAERTRQQTLVVNEGVGLVFGDDDPRHWMNEQRETAPYATRLLLAEQAWRRADVAAYEVLLNDEAREPGLRVAARARCRDHWQWLAGLHVLLSTPYAERMSVAEQINGTRVNETKDTTGEKK